MPFQSGRPSLIRLSPLLLLAGCWGDIDWGGDTGGGSEDSGPADSDSDSGHDLDSDGGDSDSATDSGADSAPDTGVDSDSAPDTGVDSDSDSDTDTGADTDTAVDSDSGGDSGVDTAATWYRDVDGDGYGDPALSLVAASPPPGWVAEAGDCDDGAAGVNPGAAEACNGVDDDCDTEVDEGPVDAPTWYPDADADGFGADAGALAACAAPEGFVAEAGDCDDADAARNPGAPEVCDETDDDCDGAVDEEAVDALPWYGDADGDGWGSGENLLVACAAPEGFVDAAGDCDDAAAAVNPDALDLCNGEDDDCDGAPDDYAPDAPTWHPDADGDGYGDAGVGVAACEAPEGTLADASDCDDRIAMVHPGADEACNTLDDDCDGDTDEDPIDGLSWYADQDGDGHGDPASTTVACAQPEGWAAIADDCNDAAASAWPGAVEACDAIDNDCDAVVDENDSPEARIWYRDLDGDLYGDSDVPTRACFAPDGYVEADGDCFDRNAEVNPGALEYCNGWDDDCDADIDEPDAVDAVTLHPDEDGDGRGDPSSETVACLNASDGVEDASDCDDTRAEAFPGAPELCNGMDDDCNDLADDEPVDARLWYADADADRYGLESEVVEACTLPEGYSARHGDCDDGDGDVFPGAVEVCDEVDQDCDGEVDDDPVDAGEWYLDEDGDGHGVAGDPVLACAAPEGMAAESDDCDDSDAQRFPGNPELCNGWDDDCDDQVDIDAEGAPTYYRDADGDGFGRSPLVICEQPEGWVEIDGDCNDRAAETYPDAPELCDLRDNDCDEEADEAEDLVWTPWYRDGDGDGYGDPEDVVSACGAPDGYVADGSDCDDSDYLAFPGAEEVCDGDDDDCDGEIDDPDVVEWFPWYADADGDGWGDPAVLTEACAQPHDFVDNDGDCDDGLAEIHPDAPEQCDEIDNNCDGRVDETDGALITPWYADLDGDGYGDPAVWTPSCIPLEGMIDNADDCDDEDAAIYLGADEYCNGVDDDCDGEADDGIPVDAYGWFIDADGDGVGSAETIAMACEAPPGFVADPDDCDDLDPNRSPALPELCNGIDDNCDSVVDEDEAVDAPPWYADSDGDGWGSDARVHPACAMPEGYLPEAGDCDDDDPATHPEAAELCNDLDDDCDDEVDEEGTIGLRSFYADNDLDGYGDPASSLVSCAAVEGYVEDDQDCDDLDPDISPAAGEACNGWDDNCDGSVDGEDASGQRSWYADLDLDGYGAMESKLQSCDAPVGYVPDGSDCDDGDALVSPEAAEVCGNDVDDDCDGDDPPCGPFGRRPLEYADSIIAGEDAGDGFGVACDLAPDLDGDGIDDVVVGGIGVDDGASEGGGVYVFGNPAGGALDASAATATLTGDGASGLAGRSVRGVGDVDGDGFGDLLIGAYRATVDGEQTGAAYLVHGPVVGDLPLAFADARLVGELSGDWAGYSVAPGGDVDGDGLGDLLVSAPYEDTMGSRAGAVYAVSGLVSGDVALGDAWLSLYGEASLDRAGAGLLGPGDLDGDGTDDLVVGAWGNGEVARTAGAAYVVYAPQPGAMALGDADTKLGGEDRGDQAGIALAAPGDMDGDGLPDLVVGADGAAAAYLVVGAPVGAGSLTDAWAVFSGEDLYGHAGWAVDGAGDVDGDGELDLLIGAYDQSTGIAHQGVAYIACGPFEGDYDLVGASGRLAGSDDLDGAGYAVAGGSDLDGDGYSEVLVGAWGADAGGASSGAVYLFYGGSR